ncbi:MAG: polysaccharide deacetylase family protein [Alphaproteobacteria bacterium]|nr:polysaccharide deacetylase family protein [Alphaproteobacteria bacterium]
MRVVVSFDLEHDCPPYLEGYRGMEDGAPRLLALLAEKAIPATFFTTGDVARRFPEVMRQIAGQGHEVGCHGDTHRRFSDMTTDEARRELEAASEALRVFAPVTSFRAPNLDFPEAFLPLLSTLGYTLDSSQAAYKPHKGHPRRPNRANGLLRVPASTMPSVVRLPMPLRMLFVRLLRDPVVLFFHPWEFVDVTREPIPYDCRYRTGAPALESLSSVIDDLRHRGGRFVRARDLIADEPLIA